MGVLSSQLKVIKTHIEDAKDAINVKYEETNKPPINNLKTGEIADRVLAIPALDTTDATATSGDILYPRTAYVNHAKVEGTMQNYSTAFTVLSIVDDKVSHDNSPSFTCKLPYTGYFTSDTALILKASDLKDWGLTPDKITKGETWMGIEGTGGIDTTDATAVAKDILSGKTAYVNDEKVTGAMTELNGQYSWPPVRFPSEQPSVNYPDSPSTVSYNLKTSTQYDSAHIGPNTKFELKNTELINFLGITPDKIKKGETISYVKGNYEGVDTSDATATPEDLRVGETAYVNGEKITGKLSSWAVAHVDIKKKNSSSFDLKFTSGIYLDTSTVMLTFSKIVNAIGLKPEDIIEGRTVLGVQGKAKAGADSSDATATANDIAKSKTAYVNNAKVTGTLMDYTLYENRTLTVESAGESALGCAVQDRGIYDPNTGLVIPYSAIVSKIGLKANMIKKGVTVLGITGTYEGGSSTPEAPEVDPEDPSKSYYNYDTTSYMFRSDCKWGLWEIMLGSDNHNNYSNMHYRMAYYRLYNAFFLNGQGMDGYFVTSVDGDKTYHNTYYEINGINYLTCYLRDLELTPDECHYIYRCLQYDSPELMMKFTTYRYNYDSSGYVTYMFLDNFDETTRQSYINACFETFKQICPLIYANYGIETSTPYQSYRDSYGLSHYTEAQKVKIAKIIHDYLVTHNNYHSSSIENLDQTMYPALSRGAETPVCASYAHAFQWCCHKFGIACYVVPGSTDSEGNARHLWNMVCYKKDAVPTLLNIINPALWYEVDVTWDDPIGSAANYCSWEFFNTTTAYIQGSNGGNRRRSYMDVTSYGNEAYYSFIVDTCTATQYTYNGNTLYGGM